MQQNKLLLSIFVAAVFVVGAGYLVYSGRPVMKLQNQPAVVATPTSTAPIAATPKPTSTTPTPAPTPAPTPTPTPAPADQPGVYTMATVAKHKSASDCWSVVNGNVYDLTSWINRHPGGPDAIIGMCGGDGTAAYEDQHGGSRRPTSMLALLKIGVLK